MADKVFKAYKQESRSNWGTSIPKDQSIDREQILLGAVLRIADSMEKMEQPFQQLINDREHFKNATNRLAGENKKLRKQVAAYQGIIKRMKKQRS